MTDSVVRRTLPIILPPETHERLRQLAKAEERDPVQQARYILRCAIDGKPSPEVNPSDAVAIANWRRGCGSDLDRSRRALYVQSTWLQCNQIYELAKVERRRTADMAAILIEEALGARGFPKVLNGQAAAAPQEPPADE